MLTISIKIFTSSRLCLGSTLEKTLPLLPDKTVCFYFFVNASNSEPVKHESCSFYPALIIFNSFAIATAVSFESPVIIITLIPAVLQA